MFQSPINPSQWIREMVAVRGEPPLLYVAHPVAAQPGETLATCLQCNAARLYAVTDVVDLHSMCEHDAPVRTTQIETSIVTFNVQRALRWWRWLDQLQEASFTMPWVTNVTANHANEFDASRVERGLRDDCLVARRCEGIVLVGPRVSRGMKIEAEAVHAAGGSVFRIESPWSHGEPPLHHPAQIPWRRYL